MPADGRNHKKTHRIEFNKRLGRWICGCGWKSEPMGKKRDKRNPDKRQKPEETAAELPMFFNGHQCKFRECSSVP